MSIRYKGRMFSVDDIKAKANGRDVHFERVRANNVVVMLAEVHGKIVMERQKRPAIGRRILELPAGHIEKGESPGKAALREFEEETGYRAASAKLLFSCYMAPGLLTQMNHNFLLNGIRKGRVSRDMDEEMEIVLVSLRKALSMISNNGIVDGKSIALILWAARKRLI